MTKNKKEDYEQLGKIVASIYETGYIDAGKTYKMSLIKGFVQGFGGVIGATLGIALLVLLLTFLGDIPIVGRFFETARDTISK